MNDDGVNDNKKIDNFSAAQLFQCWSNIDWIREM